MLYSVPDPQLDPGVTATGLLLVVALNIHQFPGPFMLFSLITTRSVAFQAWIRIS